MVAAAFSIPYIVLGSPFSYQVLIMTQMVTQAPAHAVEPLSSELGIQLQASRLRGMASDSSHSDRRAACCSMPRMLRWFACQRAKTQAVFDVNQDAGIRVVGKNDGLQWQTIHSSSICYRPQFQKLFSQPTMARLPTTEP